MSPSSRGRGLKYAAMEAFNAGLASPSSRGRGLKFGEVIRSPIVVMVALFTRAWIEIDVSEEVTE